MPADAPALVGQLLAGRQVDARELEEPDRLVARVDVHPRRLDETVEQRRPQHGVLAAHRLGEPQRARVADRTA